MKVTYYHVTQLSDIWYEDLVRFPEKLSARYLGRQSTCSKKILGLIDWNLLSARNVSWTWHIYLWISLLQNCSRVYKGIEATSVINSLLYSKNFIIFFSSSHRLLHLKFLHLWDFEKTIVFWKRRTFTTSNRIFVAKPWVVWVQFNI